MNFHLDSLFNNYPYQNPLTVYHFPIFRHWLPIPEVIAILCSGVSNDRSATWAWHPAFFPELRREWREKPIFVNSELFWTSFVEIMSKHRFTLLYIPGCYRSLLSLRSRSLRTGKNNRNLVPGYPSEVTLDRFGTNSYPTWHYLPLEHRLPTKLTPTKLTFTAITLAQLVGWVLIWSKCLHRKYLAIQRTWIVWVTNKSGFW